MRHTTTVCVCQLVYMQVIFYILKKNYNTGGLHVFFILMTIDIAVQALKLHLNTNRATEDTIKVSNRSIAFNLEIP